MPLTPSSKMAACLRPSRLAVASVVAGFSLGAPLLAPTAANAAEGDSFTILYNTETQPGTASPYGNLFAGFVQGVFTELAPDDDGLGRIEAKFTSNFGTDAEYANDFVLNLFNLTGPQIPTSIDGSCTNGFGTQCISNVANQVQFDTSSFISSTGWNTRLNTCPPNEGLTGGNDCRLNSIGQDITFTIVAANLNINSFQPATTGNQANGFLSCTHGQGLPNLTQSTLICGNKVINDVTEVPGPLPILGAAAAFTYSRKIRTRIQGSRQQATIS
jgi:hypothetical protein